MSVVRTIYFPDRAPPSWEDVTHLVEDFFGAFLRGIDQAADKSLFMHVYLHDRISWALRRQAGLREPVDDVDFQRSMTLRAEDARLSVETSMEDEATVALADGLAKLIARYWAGILVEE